MMWHPCSPACRPLEMMVCWIWLTQHFAKVWRRFKKGTSKIQRVFHEDCPLMIFLSVRLIRSRTCSKTSMLAYLAERSRAFWPTRPAAGATVRANSIAAAPAPPEFCARDAARVRTEREL